MINMAMSVDGKASSVAREPTAFTSSEDKRSLMKIRAECDALIVAARTAVTDCETMGIPDPRLRAIRVRRGQTAHPIRVIVSGRLNLLPSLRVFHAPISPLLVVCSEMAPTPRRRIFEGLARLIVCGRREVDVRRLISILSTEYQTRIILCEGGPTLNDAFFRANLVDELCLTLCPRIVGGETAPTLVDGIGVPQLSRARRGRLISCRKGKHEWFLRYRFAGCFPGRG